MAQIDSSYTRKPAEYTAYEVTDDDIERGLSSVTVDGNPRAVEKGNVLMRDADNVIVDVVERKRDLSKTYDKASSSSK